MGIFHRKKKADNGASALPDDHGEGSSRETYRERHHRPSRIDGLRNDLASTMRTFRGEPPPPPDEDEFASFDESAHHEYTSLDDSTHHDSAYRDNSEDCVDYSDQPNEQLCMRKPLSILHKRRGLHEQYRPWEEELADIEWKIMDRRTNRRAVTPDSVGSLHSLGSELSFERRQMKRPERHVNEDPAWEQDGLDRRQASWGEGSHTADPFNTEYDLPEEDCSFGSDQPFMATAWDAEGGLYTAGPVNTEYNHSQEDRSSSRLIMPIGWEGGQPLQAVEYSASGAQYEQSAHPTDEEHDDQHDETDSRTSADRDYHRIYLQNLARRRQQQYC